MRDTLHLRGRGGATAVSASRAAIAKSSRPAIPDGDSKTATDRLAYKQSTVLPRAPQTATFATDIFTLDNAREELAPILDKVWSHCEGTTIRARTGDLEGQITDFKESVCSAFRFHPLVHQYEE